MYNPSTPSTVSHDRDPLPIPSVPQHIIPIPLHTRIRQHLIHHATPLLVLLMLLMLLVLMLVLLMLLMRMLMLLVPYLRVNMRMVRMLRHRLVVVMAVAVVGLHPEHAGGAEHVGCCEAVGGLCLLLLLALALGLGLRLGLGLPLRVLLLLLLLLLLHEVGRRDGFEELAFDAGVHVGDVELHRVVALGGAGLGALAAGVVAAGVHQGLVGVGERVLRGEHHGVHLVERAGRPARGLALVQALDVRRDGAPRATCRGARAGQGHVHGQDVLEVGEVLA